MTSIRFLTFFSLLSLPALTAISQDTAPPELKDVRFHPAVVDVTHGPVDVRIEFDITDDVSGFSAGAPQLKYENTVFRFYLGGGDIQAGTPLDGTYAITITIPEASPPGERTLSVVLWDNEGRTKVHHTDARITVLNGGIFDREPPTLHSVTIEPKVLDLTNGPQTVTISMDWSDDVSGIQTLHAGIAPTDPDSTLVDDRSWRRFFTEGSERLTVILDIPMGEYTPAGEWQLTLSNVVDRVLLASKYNDYPERLVEDFDATFEVINPNGDATPPELISVEFTETVANTAFETSFLPWRVQFADEPAGVELVSVYLYAPSGGDNYIFSGKIYDQLDGLDINGDTVEGIMEVPRFIEEGKHRVQVLMRDVAGNSIKYGHLGDKLLPEGSTEFITVEESAGKDTTDIIITDFSYTPDPIDITASSQVVTFQLDFEDDLSGLRRISLRVADPAGDTLVRPNLTIDDLLSGTPTAGTLFSSFEVPRYSPPGDYRIRSLTSVDQAGNVFSDASYPVFPLNLPSSFKVINNGPVETNPPEILSVDLPQTVIEIIEDRTRFPITVQARDDLSGVQQVWIRYALDGDTDQDILFSLRAPADVVDEQGMTLTMAKTGVLREFAVPGTYALHTVWVGDYFGLRRDYDVQNPSSLPSGLPTELTVINENPADRKAPEFTGIRLSSTAFDVSNYPGSLTIEIDFTEDTSGLEHVSIKLYNRDKFYRVELLQTLTQPERLNLVSGDRMQGTLRQIVEIPRFIPAGTYELQFNLQDRMYRDRSLNGSHADFPFPGQGLIEITNAGSVDYTNPQLRDLLISETVDVSNGPAVTSLIADVIDDLAGMGRIYIKAESPSGSDFRNDLVRPRSDDGSPIKEARIPLTLKFPAFAEPGDWRLEVTLQDRNAGYRKYESIDLDRFGLPSVIRVINTQPPGYLWKDSDTVLPEGWREVEWFGWVQDQGDYPYVYHLEHGWIYTSGSDLSAFSFYEVSKGLWWWIDGALYPWMYAYPGSGPVGWYYYYAPFGSPGQRWFYDPQSGQSVPESTLFAQ